MLHIYCMNLLGSATDMQDTEVPNNNDTDTTHREPTEGEKMTQALKEMINQFTAKVIPVNLHFQEMTIPTATTELTYHLSSLGG